MKFYLFVREKPLYLLLVILLLGFTSFGVYHKLSESNDPGQVKGVSDFGGSDSKEFSNRGKNQIISQSGLEQSPEGNFEYQKSIVNTNMDEFTITLDIITKDVIQKVEGMGASVVLVMDISESMDRVSGGKKVLDHAKDAATVFANEFLTNGVDTRRLGLVSYDEIATDELRNPYDPKPEESLTNDRDKYINAINNLKTYNGQTNIQAGLQKARTILEKDTSGNPQYIIVFSDGAANRSFAGITADPIGKTVITPYQVPNGPLLNMSFKLSSFDYGQSLSLPYSVDGYSVDNHYYPTISEGILAKEQYDIDVYTVLFHSDALVEKDYHEAVFTMLNVASKGQYHEVKDITNLKDLFYDLEQDIIEKGNIWKVIDPMAKFITFEGFEQGFENSGATFDKGNQTIKWDLLKAPIVEEDLVAGWHRYSLSYNIRLESNAENFINGQAYPTNGPTTLYYFVGQDAVTGQAKKVEFTVPEVIGLSSNSKYLHVTPLDMVAYQGGESASNNTFPRPYFTLKYDDGTELTNQDLETLTFYMDDVLHKPFEHEYFIYEYPFRAFYINKQTGEIHNDPNEEIHPEDVGNYVIQLTTKDKNGRSHVITAENEDGKKYDFRFNQNASLEVRAQNQSEPTKFMKVLPKSDLDKYSINDPTPFASADTRYVNSAGFLLENLYATPDVRLMVDSVFPKVKDELGSVLKQLSIMEGKVYRMVYLDLVDHADGNIIVRIDKPITILYPYPHGTNKDTTFTVLHFYAYNREVGGIPNYAMNTISSVNREGGIAFEVTDFSPFVIAFETTKFRVNFHLNGGAGKEPLNQYDERLVDAGEKINKPDNPSRPGYTFLGWETTINWNTYLWNFDTDTVQGDMTLVARWRSNNGGGGSSNPPEAEKFDHFAYLQGYPDKTFQTMGNMSRAEAAMMIGRLLAEQMDIPFSYKTSFSDVRSNTWYANAVGYLQLHGIVQGYGGKYRPNESITRAEFIVLLTAFEEVKSKYPLPFKDVPRNHWASSQIALAAEKGWIEGYEDGTFKPDQFISRAEVATITNHVMKRIPDRDFIGKHEVELVTFKDLLPTFWGYYEVMETTNGHDFTRSTNGGEVWTSIRK